MKIAVPMAQEKLSLHFGHCEKFAIIDIDDNNQITSRTDMTPPPHEPGVLPKWLHELSVNVIIAGGMGQRAQQLFQIHGIKVITGAAGGSVEDLVADFLAGTLVTGANVCDH